MIISIIGIVFIMILMSGFFSKNEWRMPLLELSSELEGGVRQEMQAGVKRRMVFITVFFLGAFSVAGWRILKSPFSQNYRNITLIILGIILLWFLKGVYEMFRACYSKKTRLLNYLYSPYLFAWRRDFLSEYSDYEIATVILKVCDIQDDSLLKEDMNLKEFLINLHQETRPAEDSGQYLKLLEDNISQARQMRLH